jgi:hypothetical protein
MWTKDLRMILYLYELSALCLYWVNNYSKVCFRWYIQLGRDRGARVADHWLFHPCFALIYNRIYAFKNDCFIYVVIGRFSSFGNLFYLYYKLFIHETLAICQLFQWQASLSLFQNCTVSMRNQRCCELLVNI